MSEPRKHHYVPAFYLAGFTPNGSKEGPLTAIDKEEVRPFERTPITIGFQRDLYRVDHPDLEPTAVEKAFSQVEDEVAPSLKRLTDDGEEVSREDIGRVLNLVAMLAVRVPAVRKTLSNFIERVGERVTTLTLSGPGARKRYERFVQDQVAQGADEGELPTFEKIREGWETGGFRLEANATYLTLETFRASATIYGVLAARKWQVLSSSQVKAGPIVTCDRPVCLYWKKETDRGFYGPGFGLADTEVLFPLDRRHLLLGTWEGETGRALLPRRGVAYANGRSILNADRHVYSPSSLFNALHKDGTIVRGTRFLKGLQ